jgi:hypothetical protein
MADKHYDCNGLTVAEIERQFADQIADAATACFTMEVPVCRACHRMAIVRTMLECAAICFHREGDGATAFEQFMGMTATAYLEIDTKLREMSPMCRRMQ